MRSGASQHLLRRRWELPSHCSGGGVGASQIPSRRRSGSFPAAAQEEEWELPNYCSGAGVGAPNYCPVAPLHPGKLLGSSLHSSCGSCPNLQIPELV